MLKFDFIVLIGFTFQGLLSFSRGGMIVGALSILIILLNSGSGNEKKTVNFKGIFISLLSFISLYGIFEVANTITKGNLLLRYQGQTQGTLSGSKEVSAAGVLGANK